MDSLKRSAAGGEVAQDLLALISDSITHLISIYDPENDIYRQTRWYQFSDFISWVKSKAGSEPLILGGDFNFGPGMPDWGRLYEVMPSFKQAPNSDEACTVCPPSMMYSSNEGKLDHLFASPGLLPVSGAARMDRTFKVDGLDVNMSDHFG